MYPISLDAVEKFICSLDLPYKVAKGILRSNEDCDLFHKNFYLKNRNVVDDLLDFKEYKISKSNIELNDFLMNCREKGIHATFEQTFLQSLTSEDIKLIENALSTGKTTLTQVFNDFIENPNKNVMKNIL